MKSLMIFAATATLGLLTLATGANAGAAVTTGALKLLDGPVAGAALVTTLPKDARVGVLWCGMQKKWCLVSFHAKQGFVDATALQLIGGAVADTDEFDSQGHPIARSRSHTSSKDQIEQTKTQLDPGPTYPTFTAVNPMIMKLN